MLLEALIALVLLAVGVLGLASATGIAARQTDVARARHRLAVRAHNEMERLLAWPGSPTADDSVSADRRLDWSVMEQGALRLRLVTSLGWRGTTISDTLVMVFGP